MEKTTKNMQIMNNNETELHLCLTFMFIVSFEAVANLSALHLTVEDLSQFKLTL